MQFHSYLYDLVILGDLRATCGIESASVFSGSANHFDKSLSRMWISEKKHLLLLQNVLCVFMWHHVALILMCIVQCGDGVRHL